MNKIVIIIYCNSDVEFKKNENQIIKIYIYIKNERFGSKRRITKPKKVLDASVLKLGFSQLATQARGSAYYGQGSGPIWIDDVACTGSESHIYDCRHRGWGNNACTHSRDAGVQCSYGSANIRLVNGGVNYGRVEVYYNSRWGTVCDDGWDINDAHVVCRQLGFPSASSALCCAGYGQGSGTIWMDDVQCSGTEASLFHCARNDWGTHNCVHGEDASVVCNT